MPIYISESCPFPCQEKKKKKKKPKKKQKNPPPPTHTHKQKTHPESKRFTSERDLQMQLRAMQKYIFEAPESSHSFII